MRPTSSTRSSGIATSLVARHEGTVTRRIFGSTSVTPNWRVSRMGRTWGTSRPSFRASQSRSSVTGCGSGRSARSVGKAAHQPDTRRKKRQQFNARGPARGRCCAGPALFRNASRHRFAASARTEVLRMLEALKLALSSTMEVVAVEIALSRPPITPAMAIGPAASAITRLDGVEFVLLIVERGHSLAGARRARRRLFRPPVSRDQTRASAARVPP